MSFWRSSPVKHVQALFSWLHKTIQSTFATSHTTDLRTRLQPFRKIRLAFRASILAVFIATVFTLSQTAFYISTSRDLYFFNFLLVKSDVSSTFQNDLLRVWNTTQCFNISSCPSLHSTSTDEQVSNSSNRFVMVFDFWERMINVQSALHRLVLLGVDAGFTVVEPFFFESKVSPYYAFPEQFESKNMVPQPATLYFQTEDLYNTKHFISHQYHRQHIRVDESSSGSRAATPQYVIHTAVQFEWTPPVEEKAYSSADEAFRWCDDVFSKEHRPRSEYGWQISKNVHVQRVLCISSNATQSPARFSSRLFDDIFSFVEQETAHISLKCRGCISIAFLNYRKHAFTGYVSSTGVLPFQESIEPMGLGQFPRQMARRVHLQLLRDKPYVAMQMRTGKAFSYFENDERRRVAAGEKVNRYHAFEKWMANCTAEVIQEAKRQAEGLGSSAVFYIASDMYNNGWKGGETAPTRVTVALNAAKKSISEELRTVYWFKPKEFGVSQDVMGISGLVDAAICLQANRFVYALPSNFGNWVAGQRAGEEKAETKVLNCMDGSFKD